MKQDKHIVAALIIILTGLFLHKNYINYFPSHIHAWAQSDRYALAHGFVNNNLNFLKPETFVYNHQFPNNWEVPSTESITAVDFPIHDYIPAIFMKLSGNTSPWIFRVYILLYSFLGLFYLFQLGILLTKNFTKSIFITVFAATSPVFVYYQSSFLPSIPSLANAIIGVFAYTKFIAINKNRQFNIGILFLTLATLSRTTFAIPLIAVLGFELLRVIKGQSRLKPKIIPVLLSLATILIFFFYNNFLRATYGSIFLNHFLPADSLQQCIEILVAIKEKWLNQYLSGFHYMLIASMFVTTVVLVVLKKAKSSQLQVNIFYLCLLIMAGCFAFAILMLRQFPFHDYYFLDTFFLPILILLTLILSLLPNAENRKYRIAFQICVVAVSIPLILNANSSQKLRYSDNIWDHTLATINNFDEASNFLDSIGIPSTSKMLVLNAHAPNIPFILMDKKGFAILDTKRENIEDALTWDYDYVVTQNEFFLSEVYASYPEIITKTKRMWDNGRITISIPYEVEKEQSLHEYLGITNRLPVRKEIINFDTIASNSWHNIKATSEYSYSGTRAGALTKNMKYGITFVSKNMPELENSSRLLVFQSQILYDTLANVEIVAIINENGTNTYYKTYKLLNYIKEEHIWSQVDLIYQLPKIKSDDYKFSLYLMNTGKSKLFIDDLQFTLY